MPTTFPRPKEMPRTRLLGDVERLSDEWSLVDNRQLWMLVLHPADPSRGEARVFIEAKGGLCHAEVDQWDLRWGKVEKARVGSFDLEHLGLFLRTGQLRVVGHSITEAASVLRAELFG